MRMKAAVLYGVNEPVIVEEVELDPPKAGEVLVKMVATGICHSDLHRYTGDSETQVFPIFTSTSPAFGDAQFRTDIPRYISLYEQGQINLDDLVTKEIGLEDINEAFQNVIAGNKVARQVIRYQ